MLNNEEKYISLKKEVLQNQFKKMNAMQMKAVFQVDGPLLILAGAGSGKTTVLVNRIANMMNFGNAYNNDSIKNVSDEAIEFLESVKDAHVTDVEDLKKAVGATPINPWNILAITFTNKAANELKERLEKMLGEKAASINAGTFHSVCLKILRREINLIGYEKSFSIYDTDDSVRVIKDCLSDMQLDEKMFIPKAILGQISSIKDTMKTPNEYLEENSEDFRNNVIGKIYKLYQYKLKESNAVDFDDIICLTVKLLKENADVLEHYQNLYKYILVDEYQDTNHVQYTLVSLLSKKSRNLCVVGDDDQSIYKFRGATIENILNFEKEFTDATVIRLEQNYRSTQNILDAANEVIKNNKSRKGKNLWTDNGEGEKIICYRSQDENSEANFVSNKILANVAMGDKFADHAILYRMNAQSANVERAFVKSGIPYRIVGGTKFFERKEIKDILSYFKLLVNPTDKVSLKRIINEPKRGIGDTTVKNVENIATQASLSMLEVMSKADKYDLISKKSSGLIDFYTMIQHLTQKSKVLTLDLLLDEVMEKTVYRVYLQAQGKEGENRLENIAELKSVLIKYHEENPEGDLSGFLEEISLYTDLDNLNNEDDKVTMMTMHSAKGLEYKNVFIVGMEENIFPSYRASSSDEELEEERRLAYVALTRAKENLYVLNSAQRMLFGRTSRNQPSRFLAEIPERLVTNLDDTPKTYGYNQKREKPKPVYRPEVEGTVGVQKQTTKATIDYNIGDTVVHAVFGKGKVKSMSPMSNDVLVEVVFDGAGSKKIMANFAKLNKM